MADARTGAELFVAALEEYGVERVFGNPGTTELPVIRAVAEGDLEYVLGLHEDVAVGMAGGYAQTRRYRYHRERVARDAGDDGAEPVPPVGVVNLHTIGGVAHGLGNLYNAAVAGAPLLVTAGEHATDFAHEEPILSGDLEAATEGFCKWAAVVEDVAALPTMLRRAIRVAATPPTGPAFLGLPLDVARAETGADPERLGPIPNAGRGDPAQVERAAELLADADAPVLVAGDGIARSGIDAVEAAVDLAEAAATRVHGEALASEVNLPTDHELWVSHVPPYEAPFRAVMNTDTVVLAGCSTHTTLIRHEEPLIDPETTTLIQVSDDAREVGKNHPADAAVVGDPGLVLAELADLVAERVDDDRRAARREQVELFEQLAAREVAEMGPATDEDDPRPGVDELVDAMRRAAPRAYVVDESVSARFSMLTRWDHAPEGFLGTKGNALGYGLPAAVGAAIAEAERPDPRPVYGFVGDGSYLYYPQALYTAARYGVDVTVVVPNNRSYRILEENAAAMFEESAAADGLVGVDLEPAVDLAAGAESHGGEGFRVEASDELDATLAAALDVEGPSVVDVQVQ